MKKTNIELVKNKTFPPMFFSFHPNIFAIFIRHLQSCQYFESPVRITLHKI